MPPLRKFPSGSVSKVICEFTRAGGQHWSRTPGRAPRPGRQVLNAPRRKHHAVADGHGGRSNFANVPICPGLPLRTTTELITSPPDGCKRAGQRRRVGGHDGGDLGLRRKLPAARQSIAARRPDRQRRSSVNMRDMAMTSRVGRRLGPCDARNDLRTRIHATDMPVRFTVDAGLFSPLPRDSRGFSGWPVALPRPSTGRKRPARASHPFAFGQGASLARPPVPAVVVRWGTARLAYVKNGERPSVPDRRPAGCHELIPTCRDGGGVQTPQLPNSQEPDVEEPGKRSATVTFASPSKSALGSLGRPAELGEPGVEEREEVGDVHPAGAVIVGRADVDDRPRRWGAPQGLSASPRNSRSSPTEMFVRSMRPCPRPRLLNRALAARRQRCWRRASRRGTKPRPPRHCQRRSTGSEPDAPKDNDFEPPCKPTRTRAKRGSRGANRA